MTAKERKYVTVMSVGFPGVILWHVVCPKLCRALPEASHLTLLWPGIINHHLALLPQESDLRSVRLCKKAVRRAVGRIVIVWRYCALSPIFLLCFPVVSHFVIGVVLLSIRSMQGFQCRCCQFQVLDGPMLRRSTNAPCSVQNCHMWHGRLHIRQN